MNKKSSNECVIGQAFGISAYIYSCDIWCSTYHLQHNRPCFKLLLTMIHNKNTPPISLSCPLLFRCLWHGFKMWQMYIIIIFHDLNLHPAPQQSRQLNVPNERDNQNGIELVRCNIVKNRQYRISLSARLLHHWYGYLSRLCWQCYLKFSVLLLLFLFSFTDEWISVDEKTPFSYIFNWLNS